MTYNQEYKYEILRLRNVCDAAHQLTSIGTDIEQIQVTCNKHLKKLEALMHEEQQAIQTDEAFRIELTEVLHRIIKRLESDLPLNMTYDGEDIDGWEILLKFLQKFLHT